MSSAPKLSSFVRLDGGEVFDRDYYLAHTCKWRFTLPRISVLAIVGLISLLLGGFIIAFAFHRVEGHWGYLFLGVPILIVPPSLVLLYILRRRLKISHGYATLTNRRVLYYEYNDHPAVNYQQVRSLHLDDITGIDFEVERSWFSKSLRIIIYTSKKGLAIGAKGFLGWFNFFGSELQLEPGPDALEFIQHMTGAIAARQMQGASGSGKITG